MNWCFRVLLALTLALLSWAATFNPFVELFGDTLYKWSAEREISEYNTSVLLKNKDAVAVYFSASWYAVHPFAIKYIPHLVMHFLNDFQVWALQAVYTKVGSVLY
jgi:hypothetical protein